MVRVMDISYLLRNVVANWRWVASLLAINIILGSAYFALAPNKYVASVEVVSTGNDGGAGVMAQLAGLAALAGVDVADSSSARAVAILDSRDLIRAFIAHENIEVDIGKRYLGTGYAEAIEQGVFDIRDVVAIFEKDFLDISEDKKAGTVLVKCTWYDPRVVASWCQHYVEYAMQYLHEREVGESTRRVAYLQRMIMNDEFAPVQLAVSKLLESELQRQAVLAARGGSIFSIIDSAVIPKTPESPRLVRVGVTTALAALFSLFIFAYAVDLAGLRRI